jgi:hypothetical protein
MNPNPIDPVIDEIRELRHRISERCGHDPVRLVAYYQQVQEQYRDRLAGPANASDQADNPLTGTSSILPTPSPSMHPAHER